MAHAVSTGPAAASITYMTWEFQQIYKLLGELWGSKQICQIATISSLVQFCHGESTQKVFQNYALKS